MKNKIHTLGIRISEEKKQEWEQLAPEGNISAWVRQIVEAHIASQKKSLSQ
jgi:predicted DNA-binding protein